MFLASLRAASPFLPDQEIAKPKRSYDLPHPSKRRKGATPRRVKQQAELQAGCALAVCRDSVFSAGQACDNEAGQTRPHRCECG